MCDAIACEAPTNFYSFSNAHTRDVVGLATLKANWKFGIHNFEILLAFRLIQNRHVGSFRVHIKFIWSGALTRIRILLRKRRSAIFTVLGVASTRHFTAGVAHVRIQSRTLGRVAELPLFKYSRTLVNAILWLDFYITAAAAALSV